MKKSSLEILNSLPQDYPGAFSMAAGMPKTYGFSPEDISMYISLYEKEKGTWNQYHQTEGLINSLASNILQSYDPDVYKNPEVMIFSGNQEFLTVSLKTLNPSAILTTVPSYPGLIDCAKILGFKILFWDPDKHSIPSNIPKRSLIYLIPDFSSPSGRTFNMIEREQIIMLAREKSCMIYEDSVYRDFSYSGKNLPSFLSMAGEITLHSKSLNKLLLPALRLCLAILPKSLKSSFISVKAGLALNTSGLTQALAGGYWLESGSFTGPGYKNFCRDLQNSANIVKELFGKQTTLAEGGFFMTLETGRETGTTDMIKLAEKGVLVCPMTLFSPRREDQTKIRLSLTNGPGTPFLRALNVIKNYFNG